MELKDLISGPLIATVEADSASSRQYLDYLFEIGFESCNKETGEVGKLRMLTFSFMQSSHKGQTRQKVRMQQADLPGGLANLLHLTANNMTVEEENNDNNNRQP